MQILRKESREGARSIGWHSLVHNTMGKRYRTWYKENGVCLLPFLQVKAGTYWYGTERSLSFGWLILQVDVYYVSSHGG